MNMWNSEFRELEEKIVRCKTYIQALDIECDILSSFVNENSEKGTNIILDLFISVSIHM